MAPLIALEEHYLAPSLCDSGGHDDLLRTSFTPQIHEQLLDLGRKRLDDLDDGSIAVQVISHIPLPASTLEVSKANDRLYAAVTQHPTRFAAFALLDMDHPAQAAVELQRCTKDLGFVGALIGNTTTDGRFFDTPDFEAVFATAQELDTPIYLHPTYPSAEQSRQLYAGPWDSRMEANLGGWCWGWHSMVGLHVLRLFASNLFERFPNLKLIIGHSGEMLPFMLDRIYLISAHWPGAGSRSRGLREVWDSNIWVTTSGMFSMAPMSCLLQTTRKDRIMYSVDYPLAPHAAGINFMTALKDSNSVTEAEFEDIAYRTAARLLKLNVTL